MDVPGDETAPQTLTAKRILVLVVVAVVVVASSVVVWDRYFRYWTIEDVAKAMSDDPADPYFRHSLANRTVTVEGTVTDIENFDTSLGELNLVELDGETAPRISFWGPVDFAIGDRILTDVSFEWSSWNNDSRVYSPQLDFPVLYPSMGIESITFAYSMTSGVYWSFSTHDNITTIEIDWVSDPIPLDGCNLSLRAGISSWTDEYIDVLHPSDYGWEVYKVDNLSQQDDGHCTAAYDDEDADGCFSTGDMITLRDLEVPECDSGVRSYMVCLESSMLGEDPERPLPMYLLMLKNGILRNMAYADHFAALDVTEVSAGFLSTVEFSLDDTPWSDTEVQVEYSLNGSYDFGSPLVIDNSSGHPGDGTEVTYPVGSVETGDATWLVNITDADGDGLVTRGDSVSFWTDRPDLIPALDEMLFTLSYAPMSSTIDQVVLVQDV